MWKISTAQSLIFVLAVACAFVVYSTYQDAHRVPPAPLAQMPPSPRDRRQVRYAAQMGSWEARMKQQGMTVNWPYLGHDYVVRLDLPDKVPVTLAEWDDRRQAQTARKAYRDFVRVRHTAGVANPDTCIVHVFDAGGAEVAQASASGVAVSSGGL